CLSTPPASAESPHLGWRAPSARSFARRSSHPRAPRPRSRPRTLVNHSARLHTGEPEAFVTHPYRLNEVDAHLAQAAADAARDVLAANAADVDHQARFPEESLQALRHQGLLGLCVQTALGGEGAGMRAFAAVAEELATGCASTAMIYVMHVTAAQAIASSTTL